MTMQYDWQVPAGLREVQEWFGPLISRPLDTEGKILPLSIKGHLIEEEARQYIVPSATLRPHERLELYNQQYWWRLIKHLKRAYPCLKRLFGEPFFERDIIVPYLTKYPPSHWNISDTGKRLYQWVEEEYHEADK